MAADPPPTTILHASSVALDRGRGLLILGPSGAGKSALALALMAWGARLVADDRTAVRAEDGALVARAPAAAIRGRVEARGIGILAADALDAAAIRLVVDLSRSETDRLPPERDIRLAGITLPLVHRVESAHFPAAVLQYLKAGRVA